jgi:hypothetical protein
MARTSFALIFSRQHGIENESQKSFSQPNAAPDDSNCLMTTYSQRIYSCQCEKVAFHDSGQNLPRNEKLKEA